MTCITGTENGNASLILHSMAEHNQPDVPHYNRRMTEAFTGTQVRAAETPLLDAGRGPELMARAAHGLALAVVRLIRREGGRVAGARRRRANSRVVSSRV